MNHPTREDWMSYLYREVSEGERAKLAAHLRDCAICAAQINQWQATAGDLSAWPMPPRSAKPAGARAQTKFLRPTLQWAAAAMILLGVGFAAGRLSSAKPDGQRLRAAIEPELRRQLRQEFEARRLEDNRTIYSALEKLNAQRLADYVSLKKELDTVAVLTDAGLRNTEQQLAQLADDRQLTNVPGGAEK